MTGTNMEARWGDGTWLGTNARTDEALIGTQNGIVRARSVRRRSRSEQWSYEQILSIKGNPWDPTATKEPSHQETNIDLSDHEHIVEETNAAPPQARLVYIKKKDVEEFGATSGCPGCVAAAENRRGVRQTTTCRKRMEERMKGTEDGKRRLQEVEARTNEALARTVEAGERKRQQDQGANQDEEAQVKRPKRTEAQDDAKTTTAHEQESNNMSERRKLEMRTQEEGDDNESNERHTKQRRVDLNAISFYDDITHEQLNTSDVLTARADEIQYVRAHKVYRKVPCEGKKAIGIRWLDVNKGDKLNPNVRSRLVSVRGCSH